MPTHDPQRVSADVAVDLHPENKVIIAQIVCIPRRDQIREIKRCNGVAMDAAPDHLFEPDVHRAVRDKLWAQKGPPVWFFLHQERAFHDVKGRVRFHLWVRLLPQRPVRPTAKAGFTRQVAKRGKNFCSIIAAEHEGEDQPADDVLTPPLCQEPQRGRNVDGRAEDQRQQGVLDPFVFIRSLRQQAIRRSGGD